MEELKRCPFCGTSDLEVEYGSMLGDGYSEGNEVYAIFCYHCGAYMCDEDESKLIEAWNKRA